MAVAREINSRMDLSIDEAANEYVNLKEYLQSEAWVYSVIEKVERRMADLAKLVIEKIIEDKINGRTIQKTQTDNNAESKRIA